MKIKLEINGKDFEIEIEAKDMRNLNATKKATMEVLNEISIAFYQSSHYCNFKGCLSLQENHHKNHLSIYKTLKENKYYEK